MVVQPDLCLISSETPKTGFLVRRLNHTKRDGIFSGNVFIHNDSFSTMRYDVLNLTHKRLRCTPNIESFRPYR